MNHTCRALYHFIVLLSIIPYAQNGYRACIFFCLLSPMLRTGAALASSSVYYPLCSERVPRLHPLMSVIPFAQNTCRTLFLLSVIPSTQKLPYGVVQDYRFDS
ncbi:Uncharacterised protein [Chlamydia abortus]|nr:Uncharacterised protein [Chlamydia abortus]